jgi:hypothetical protein
MSRSLTLSLNKTLKIIAIFSVLFFSLITNFTFAAFDDFTVRALVGEDLIPPTTSTLISINPVAPTQIDVEWSVATDNVLLGGYVLLRDGSPIATTTLTTYIDTGLLPETLYTYEVYAFDSFDNISSTSDAVSTTTPAVYVPPVVEDTNTSESTIVFRLINLDIKTETNKAFFDWSTSIPSQFLLRWGKNDSYDSGYISGNTFRANHKTIIDNLEPGSTYLFELIGYSSRGTEQILKKGQFKTQGLESVSPANVSNLQADVLGEDVVLSWMLPENIGDGKVRIVRSHLGFPNSIYDGAVVYEGVSNNYTDRDVFVNYSPQYYSVFVIAADGSVSSGAVARVFKTSDEVGIGDGDYFESEIILPEYDFDLGNINIYQDDKIYNFKSDKIDIVATKSFLLSIPSTALPNNLKSIVVTLIDPTDYKRTYSFLLRINKEGTAYEAIISALNLTGSSRLQIEIFDYERNIAARYRKPINFIWSNENPEVVFPDVIINDYFPFLTKLFAGLMLLTSILFIIYKRRYKAEDNR